MIDSLVTHRAWIMPIIGIGVLFVIAVAWIARRRGRSGPRSRITEMLSEPRSLESLVQKPVCGPDRTNPFAKPPTVVPVVVGSETVPVLVITLSLEVLERDQALALASIDAQRAEHAASRIMLELPRPGSPSYLSRWLFRGLHVIAYDVFSKGGVLAITMDDGIQKEPVKLPLLEPSTAFSYLSLSSAIPEQERLTIVASIPVPRVLQPTDDWN